MIEERENNRGERGEWELRERERRGPADGERLGEGRGERGRLVREGGEAGEAGVEEGITDGGRILPED